jgi:hypothetical protein
LQGFAACESFHGNIFSHLPTLLKSYSQVINPSKKADAFSNTLKQLKLSLESKGVK